MNLVLNLVKTQIAITTSESPIRTVKGLEFSSLKILETICLEISLHSDPLVSLQADPGVSLHSDPPVSLQADPGVSLDTDPPVSL